MVSTPLHAATLALPLLAGPAAAATPPITPDKSTYLVGGGLGYAEAFVQLSGATPFLPDQALSARVQLLATALGTLGYGWEPAGIDSLDFFGLANAPGGSVTIVPEPVSGLLLGVGLIGLAAHRTGRVRARLDPQRLAARRGEG